MAKLFLNDMYIAILGRPADGAGLDYWENPTNGLLTVYDVYKMLYASPEYVGKATSTTDYLNNCYKTILGRAPDSAGLAVSDSMY